MRTDAIRSYGMGAAKATVMSNLNLEPYAPSNSARRRGRDNREVIETVEDYNANGAFTVEVPTQRPFYLVGEPINGTHVRALPVGESDYTLTYGVWLVQRVRADGTTQGLFDVPEGELGSRVWDVASTFVDLIRGNR